MKNSKWIGLIGISLASFLGCIDYTIVNTALPTIQADLHASITQLQWVINIFMLALAALMVVMGRLADIYGRRKLLYIGMIFFGLASLGAGVSTSIHSLIVFRALQGIGVAILYTVPIAIVSDLFPKESRGKATGILIAANGFGLAVGPVVGGAIVSMLSWRWIFYVNLPLIILSFMFCLNSLKESRSHEHGDSIDWLGLGLLVISFPTIIYATVNNVSAFRIPLYIVALFCFIAFYFVENKSKSPIIQINLFKNRAFFIGIVANFSLAFFYTVAFFLMPLFLHNIYHQSGFMIGLMLLPASIMVAILSPLVGSATDKYGPKTIMAIGFILFALSAFMQMHFSAQTSLTTIVIAFVLFGTGWACILSPSIVTVIASVPDSVGGVAMGALGTLHNFGGAIGLAIGTLVYENQAKLALMLHAVKSHFAKGHWLSAVAANPENAVRLLKQHSTLTTHAATNLFQRAFMHGYAAAMLVLVSVSIVAVATVWLGLAKKSC